MSTPLHIVWFKRDLRVEDHRPLAEAVRRAASDGGRVLPLMVVEPAVWAEPDASARQYDFMRETAVELDAALGALGQRLIVRVGGVVETLEHLRREHGIAALWSHEETGNGWTFARDRAVAAWARTHGIAWHEFRQDGVVRRLNDRNGWARRWDGLMASETVATPRAIEPLVGIETLALPTAQAIGLAPDRCPQRQRGGRAAGWTAFESFLFSRGLDYRRAMSSPVSGATSCSRLSPFLAWGAISMREVAQGTWARQLELRGECSPEGRAWRGALSSFAGRLHWHCHFMQKLESEPAIEFTELHPATRGLRPMPADAARLEAWCNGQTGYPFLDACMRSLAATGWLNFRMRAMVTSFASYNLWLPWRETGLHLARQFTDYEPGIHWPQIQMQSGTTGINTIRIYSVVKQGHDQDADGRFVRRWVPELAAVPDAFLQEPWTWDGAAGVIGRGYPERIVDLAASTKEAKDRIYGVRRAPTFHRAADAIQERHGSRKSGMPMTGQKTKSKTGAKRVRKSKQPTDQIEFDL